MGDVKLAELIQLRAEMADEQLSDEALVAACAIGDRAARGMLFERHFEAVHRFVDRMRGSDPDEVDDLVHSTFVAAFAAAARFRNGSVRAWLYGIAANLTRTYARHEIRRKRTLETVAELDRPVRALDPDDRHLLAQLPEALAALPHDQRVVFVLIDLEGERGSDAAGVLGIPEGTLWRRLYDARQALRRALTGASS
jgi:RNA polymerase sigma-70 factor (ECF subfamily)